MRGKRMLKNYIVLGSLVLLVTGCTSKDTIPPMPPKDPKAVAQKVRTVSQLESKLDLIRNPIGGEDVGEQKKNAQEKVDTLLSDAKEYKGQISRFEKAQLLAYKKAKHSYGRKLKRSGKKIKKKSVKDKEETINMVNEYENKLKYY